jgi:outer membrane scaffolding protein for murein synthesis (MipA/OmpV family)
VGIGPVSVPAYASGQERRVVAAPFYILGWGDRFDLDSFNGATLWVASIGKVKIGPNLTYAPGIDKAPGLGHVSARATLGARIEWDVTEWFDFFGGAGSEVLVPDRGISGNLGAEALYEFKSTWYGYSGARLIWGNARYQANYFGVSSAEAAQGLYPVYTPGAGLAQAAIDQYVGYRIVGRWGAVAGVSYVHLLGPAAASPTIALGGKVDQWIYGVFVGYQF